MMPSEPQILLKHILLVFGGARVQVVLPSVEREGGGARVVLVLSPSDRGGGGARVVLVLGLLDGGGDGAATAGKRTQGPGRSFFTKQVHELVLQSLTDRLRPVTTDDLASGQLSTELQTPTVEVTHIGVKTREGFFAFVEGGNVTFDSATKSAEGK